MFSLKKNKLIFKKQSSFKLPKKEKAQLINFAQSFAVFFWGGVFKPYPTNRCIDHIKPGVIVFPFTTFAL